MATDTLDGLTAFLQKLDLGGIPQLPSADVLHQPIDIFHVYLAETLHTLVGCDLQHAYEAIQPGNAANQGDLYIVIPRLKLPEGHDMQELATDLVKKFPTPSPLFILPWKDGIQVRFYLSPKVLSRIALPYILDRGACYGTLTNPTPSRSDESSASGEIQRNALIEFSSPNLGQEFRPDHLRSTVLGAFVANMYEAMGWKVVRVNYLGDWGKHIGLLGLGWIRYGSSEAAALVDNDDDTDHRFRHLHEVYARMNEELRPKWEESKKKKQQRMQVRGGNTDPITPTDDGGNDNGPEDDVFGERDATFKMLEDGDAQALDLWETLRRISIEYYTKTYNRLGVAFDDYLGESQVIRRNPEVLQSVDKILKEKEISEQLDDGAWVIDFGKHDSTATPSRLGTATLRSKDGTSTYFLRDIATVMDRLDRYKFSKTIYVVGDQDKHFRQVFKTVELMGQPEVATEKLQHLTFTKGPHPPQWAQEHHLLGDILDHCEQEAQGVAAVEPTNLPPEIQSLPPAALRALAINSLILLELNTKKKTHSVNLDGETLMATDGQTVLRLELGLVRLCNAQRQLESHLKEAKASADDDASGEDPEPDSDYLVSLAESPWIELVRLLLRFPTVTAAAYKSLDPGGIISYLFSMLEEVEYCLDETAEGLEGVVAHDVEEGGEADGPLDATAAAKHATARSMLFRCIMQVLLNGMRLLNIAPVSVSDVLIDG